LLWEVVEELATGMVEVAFSFFPLFLATCGSTAKKDHFDGKKHCEI
jgi:hypothetical protein